MDAVTRIIEVLDRHPVSEWERALCQAFGGRSLYIASATGRQVVAALVAAGCKPRTARMKVYGK